MPRRERISVAIVDNSIEPEIYAPVGHWSRYLDVPWRAFIAREGELPDPAGFSHLILTGSEASILEREPWVEAEAALVRAAVAGGTAVLGSCWGHQLIAYALAGPGCVGRCPSPEIGWIAVRAGRESVLLGPAGTVHHVFSVHFDEVRGLPPEFEVLASTEACPVQAFRTGDGLVWGIQSHPEIDVPDGLRTLRDFAARGARGGGEACLAALARAPRDSGLIHRVVRGFLGL
ncbi:MAG: type 1 glutamine amidotransferase [Acidobacteria bacterium]|nr:type 1 glutamine amidotransferase [Acidobacteriota bacterium]